MEQSTSQLAVSFGRIVTPVEDGYGAALIDEEDKDIH